MPTDYAIKNGKTVMDVSLWTGTGSAQTITNSGFKPDLVWAKNRNDTYGHVVDDTVRGAALTLQTQVNSAEVNEGSNGLVAFNSNGFNIGGGSGGWNVSTKTYVGWQWNAGSGTSVSNTSGSITSTVSANPTAGFSVVTYTGTGASGTVGHGLGAAPKFIIYKSRTTTRNWLVNIGGITGTQGDYVYFNLTDAKLNSANVLNGNSTTFSLGTSPENNESGASFVAYCWSEVDGFSKFGKYTGNGSADGPFVYTGFRPKCIIVKISSGINNWFILDTTRSTYNVAGELLLPNTTNAGSDYPGFDLLSNGFKLRNNGTGVNANGDTYIYMAFAENPFKYANAR